MRSSSGPPAGRGLPLGATPPVEIRLAAALLVGGAVLFMLMALLRAPLEDISADENLFLVPVLQLAIGLGVAGGLWLGKRAARLSGLVLALLFALLHLSVALQGFALWVRIVSGLIAATQIYVAVLLNTRPALEHTGVRVRPRG
jgi:hypothetical protein